ncbi:hypothetical protein [Geobacillus sp. CAMR5420]|uniref:hypothetical protein n=1 Tax=Geobacillus TaxID=129337 RepID=UPI000FFE7010|nr:hypothetical protein [Geobacillus sp. CAMR5420]
MVQFKDEKRLTIDEIIVLEKRQIEQIRKIAAEYTMEELQEFEEYGKDLEYLTDEQKQTVLDVKNSIVGGIPSEQLYKNKVVRPGRHSLKRMFERVGSDSVEIIISIIDKIKEADTVQKAQWKGFPQLSYTLRKNADPEQYKISLGFAAVNNQRRIIIVTVSKPSSESSPPRMEQRLGNNPHLAEKLKMAKKLMKERLNKR